jgi:predicted metal-binding membrane protein
MQASQRFIGVSAALFFGSAALTIAWCQSMSALHDMPMCSVRTPSAPISPAGAIRFLLMWLTMMVAMMLPALMPMLWRYRRRVVTTTAAQLDILTALAALGYFFVWIAFGVLAFVAESALSGVEMRWPATTGVFVLAAGALQFSRWKARHLACCRGMESCCAELPAGLAPAWCHGLRLGIHCVHCCFGLTVMLLAIGMMDLRAMALVTAAICVERFVPDGLRAARMLGGIFIAAGLVLIAHAMI